MLDLLNRYSHGFVAVPVVRALDRRGVFGLLAAQPRRLADVVALAGLNPGHAAAAFDLLQSLGWVAADAGGVLRLLPAARPYAVPDALLDAYACDWSRLDAPALDLLDRFAPRIARRWDSDAELADQLSGALALPLANGPARHALAAGTAQGPLRAAFAALGWTTPDGAPTPLGAFVADRGQVTGAAGSYAPLLHAMPMLLGGDPQEVMRRDASGAERHLDRTANVIASGFQHGRYFADLEAVLAALFDAPDLDAQPAALVDMGCGDGTLLRRCWETALRSARGRHLATHPLLLVGTDFNAAALEATGRTLAGLPHLLLQGDIADPARLVRDIAARGVDPARVLHLRSFLDHDRPAVPPRADWSARAADGDRCIVVAPDGTLVPPGAVMQSLVEHLGAWRAALGAHGLMMLEVHRLPPAIVASRRDDTEAPHFDAYHAFSGQQLVPADSFVLAAAEVGLFGDPAAFRKYPRIHPFARIQLQHFRPMPWRVRAARAADLPALLALEQACWPEPALRHDAATLAARLARPRAIMVAEQDGAILAALHVQRIASVDMLRGARWGGLDALYRDDGPVLQLLGLMVRPQAQDRGLGDALADFALQWAALTPGVEAVAGLTRCRDWDRTGDYAAWAMARGADGLPRDATLRFHIGRGARLVALVPGYRPEDTANAGHAVLIAYALQPGEVAAPTVADAAPADLPAQVAECVRAVMRAGADRFDADRALRDLGLDSADLLELRTLLNRRLGLRLEASFFFDHPSPARIAQALLAPTGTQAPAPPAAAPVVAAVAAVPRANGDAAVPRANGDAAVPRANGDAAVPRANGDAAVPRANGDAAVPRAAADTAAPRAVTTALPPSDGAIAIIGLACRLPGAPDADAFWRLMEEGRDATGPVPPDRWPATPGERGGFLDDVAAFDPAAFAISAREARSMDPQQRLLLETLLATLEHAGLDPDALRGSQAGVFLGLFAQDWERRLLAAGQVPDGHFATGTSNAIAAGRLAYAFGLTGPALAVNTACSSSLVAVHLAARSLRAGECRLAFAGGASLLLMPDLSRAFADAGMLAADGRCRPFDAAAAGYARAEGVGLVALKRLADAQADGDRILAVLRGSAVNQDGASNGLTAPSGAAQRAVIAAALADAGLAPGDVDAVEAHGTGTPLGDPIEAGALAEAYGGPRAAPLLVTAAKGNIGHAEAAAGIAGLIKCVMALRAGRVPGIAHLAAPNPALRPALQAALRLADGTQGWPGDAVRPRRMAVSAFGFSGTNAHAVLEQAPAHEARAAGPLVMPLSARDGAGLRRLAAAWAEGLDGAADPAALCAAAARRRVLPARAAVTGDSTAALRAALASLAAQDRPAAPPRTPRIGFLFTGQGSQHRGMGLALAARLPRFRAALDRADAVLRPLLGRSIDDLLAAEDLGLTGLAQPAICAVQVALVDLLAGWGIRPVAVLGHSVGEIAAAHAAGILSFEDALRLAATRGRIMQALPAGGAMVALRCDEAAAQRLLDGLEAQAGVAALNGPQASVVSGAAAAMDAVCARAEAAGILAMPLRVSHAFHSPLMDPALAPFAAAMDAVALHPPRLPVLSTLSGDGFADLTDPDYWVRQIRAPVRFAAALAGMPADVLVEIGPLPVLTGLARGVGAPPCEPTLTGDGDALAALLAALHGAGAPLDWRAIHGGAHAGVDLPASPLERRRFWVDLPAGAPGVDVAPLGARAADVAPLGARAADVAPLGARAADVAPGRALVANGAPGGALVVNGAPGGALVVNGAPGGATTTDATSHPDARLGAGDPRAGVLGQRMVLPGAEEARFAARLTAGSAPFFQDHRLHGRVVVPAASHIAVALTALARLGRPAALADLVFSEPFALADDAARDAQCVIGAQAIRYVTAEADGTADAPWSTHMEAHAAAVVAATPPPALPGGLAAQSGAAFYEGFAAAGYTFGPAMRGLVAVQADGAIAAATLAPAMATDLLIDPALLDAAFQVQGVWFDTASLARDGALFVPQGVGSIILHAPPRGDCRVVARRRPRDEPDDATRIADLWLVDGDGRVALEARGFRFRRVARAALLPDRAAVPPGLLHRLDWRVQPIGARIAPAAILAPLAVPPATGDDLAEAAAQWVAQAFAQAGAPLAIGAVLADAATRLGAIPARAGMVGDMVAALRGAGVLDGAGCVLRLPGAPAASDDPAAALLARTGAQLLAVAQGRADPLALLFPEGDAAAVARLYAEAPCFAAMNALAGDVARAVARPGLAVLELGGGTGATTAALLPALAEADYLFTDVSAGFAAAAARRFPGLATAALDLDAEAPPEDARRFDLVVAANVLHALRDLPGALGRIAARLRPGGMMMLVEGTARRAWVDLTFGLLEGWHRHREGPAPRDATLIAPAGWDALLRAQGFEPAMLAAPDAGAFPQALILARRVAPPRVVVAGGASWPGAAPIGATPADAVLVVADAADPAGAAIGALQAIAARPHPPGPVWLVTRGAVAAAAQDRVPEPAQAALWGLGRVMRLEHPELDLRLVDIEAPGQLDALLADPGAAREFALRGSQRLVARVVQDAAPLAAPAWQPPPDGTLLLTGGLGGIGVRLAERLAARGARRLVLAARGAPRDGAAIEAIRRHGAEVDVAQVDVGDAAALPALVARVAPAAVFHLAGVLEDAALLRLAPEALRRAMAPKADAALLLDRLLPGEVPLVLFGSAAALIGNPGQAAHAAGNAVLAAVAAARRARGQPGLCIDWGAWAEIGTVARHNPFRGLRTMSPEACFEALWRLMGAGVAQAAVMDVDWRALAGARAVGGGAAVAQFSAEGGSPELRRDALAAHILGHLREVLAIPPDDVVDRRQGFFAMGLDSLTSVELRNRLQRSLGRALPATITFDHPNVEALSAHLLGEAAAPPDTATQEMTEEEALALIDREAARLGIPDGAA
ncbi:type I polyketide synthase [Roseomonas sp. CECT 9278]|uniref:type I polyketide synthase n=1 Tax=Roseomonas sp. CECT 9278 TaxID=2845823 RepID=UPI001E37BC2F|nr:type I polyketide synthase [Roseomonas sp. CECT 9278]CAH0159330.1 hypothetical protein ROS9278_00917 [Roseomonas sp. CECT 9278]